ncbi:hypothetical protein [Acinetobacter bereziniae]|uniref:hypothetical protein n=1 Tax=Acinetobacter bereziniae TaxID=106648 RepID=UPI0012505E38|nr:hypothetical protein [Acinetobacter bereziniae]
MRIIYLLRHHLRHNLENQNGVNLWVQLDKEALLMALFATELKLELTEKTIQLSLKVKLSTHVE